MNKPIAAGRVLIADDDYEVRWALKELLLGAGYGVAEADDGEKAAATMVAGEIDTAIIDPTIPDFDHLKQLKNIRKTAIPCIVTTFLPPTDVFAGLTGWAEVEYIPKPFHTSAVLAALERFQAKKHREEEHRRDLKNYTLNKTRHRILYDEESDQIYFLKPDGTFLDANPAGCHAVGLGLVELRGRNLRKVRIKDIRKIGIKPFKRAAAGETVHILLSYTEIKRGRLLKDIEMEQVDFDGSPAVLCRIRDLSGRKKIRK
jgi:PAS domain S-box-containing protein